MNTNYAATEFASAVTPIDGETCEQFVVRAHGELAAEIPDPYERNRVVWDSWEALYGFPERDRIEAKLGDERYVHIRDVEFWQEHESQVTDKDGNVSTRVNGVERLSQIITENNLRIRDTDSLPGLIDKHTLKPGANDKELARPVNLGYAGPFRLGMTGRVNPRFAIYGNEHHRKDRLQILEDRPQRSVEIMTLDANGRSYISSIACLSEAPRLPLPVHYSAINEYDEAGMIEQYSAVPVDSYPGGGNSYIPGGSGAPKKKQVQRFGAESTDDSQPQSQAKKMLEQDDLKQIADAIMSTPQMQFVNQMMQQHGKAAPSPSPSPAQQPGQPSAPAPGQPQKEQYMGAPAMNPGVAMRYSADEGQVTIEQYQALAKSNSELMQKVATIAKDNASLRARAADADRRQRLSAIHSKFPHVVDLDAELGRCLYSAGSQMTDDAFESHCELIEQYSAKSPVVNAMIPEGELPGRRQSTVETEKYEAEIHERSLEIYQAAMDAGQLKTPDQCWQEAEREKSNK